MQTLADEVTAAMRALDPPSQIHAEHDVTRTLQAMLPMLAEEPAPALDEPPLGFDPTLSARQTGERIAQAYARCAADERPSIPAIVAACMDRLGCGVQEKVRRAAIVGGVLASVPAGNAYHNANHTREVLCSAVWLSEANAALAASGTPGALPLDRADVARLLLLAVIHDIGHDGGTNARPGGGGRQRVPFRLEDRSFALMRPAFQRAGFDASELAEMHAVVRSTDVAVRPAVRTLTEHLLFGNGAAEDLPPELLPIARSKRLAMITALLADADILSSAALTPEYQRAQNARLEAELSAELGCEDVLTFLDRVVGGELATAAGRLLDDNLRHIRASVASRCEDVTAPIPDTRSRAHEDDG